MSDYSKDAVAVWKSGTAFEIATTSGATLISDGDAKVGMSPVEMVLAALVGCTGADVIEILRKKRQEVTRLEVRVHGERGAAHPRIYTGYQLNYIVTGHGVDPAAVRRAIELSELKYCSVSAMLRATAPIEIKFEVHEVAAASAAAQGAAA